MEGGGSNIEISRQLKARRQFPEAEGVRDVLFIRSTIVASTHDSSLINTLATSLPGIEPAMPASALIPPRPAVFIEAMECLPVVTVPEGPEWSYEIKLDGYRMEAVKSGAALTLYSRRENVLNEKFPYIAKALDYLPAGTVLDGELVAMSEDGRPNFNLLQNFRSAAAQIRYYAFDILIHKNRDLTQLTLSERREILNAVKPNDHASLSVVGEGSAAEMLHFARHHGLEGVIAKRSDSVSRGRGLASGPSTALQWDRSSSSAATSPATSVWIRSSWVLPRKGAIYASRVRAGFVPATRRKVFEQIKHLTITHCPFANLPEAASGRWGSGAHR